MKIVLTKKRYTDSEVERIIQDVAMKANNNIVDGDMVIERDFSKSSQKKGRENRFVPLKKGECW